MAASGPRILYVEIAGDIRRRIASGTPGTGERLEPLHVLTKRYGAALNTVRDALKVLAGEGLIETIPGKGSFVTGDERRAAHADGGSADLDGLRERVGRLEAHVANLYSATGVPEPGDSGPVSNGPAARADVR